jgi:hypothetical protein
MVVFGDDMDEVASLTSTPMVLAFLPILSISMLHIEEA